MGIAVLKIVIWGGKSSVLWLQIVFYCNTSALLYNKICDHKTDNLRPTKWQFWRQLIPLLKALINNKKWTRKKI